MGRVQISKKLISTKNEGVINVKGYLGRQIVQGALLSNVQKGINIDILGLCFVDIY